MFRLFWFTALEILAKLLNFFSACYVDRCVQSFVSCARQASSEELFSACKMLHKMCASTCSSGNQNDILRLWPILYVTIRPENIWWNLMSLGTDDSASLFKKTFLFLYFNETPNKVYIKSLHKSNFLNIFK